MVGDVGWGLGTLCSFEGRGTDRPGGRQAARPLGRGAEGPRGWWTGWSAGLGLVVVAYLRCVVACAGLVECRRSGARGVVENCIASASIVSASVEGHQVDALALEADEGRCRLR